MSGASMGSVGVNKVAKERLDVNLPKWAHAGGRLPRVSAATTVVPD